MNRGKLAPLRPKVLIVVPPPDAAHPGAQAFISFL
jgi:hypothetical protein